MFPYHSMLKRLLGAALLVAFTFTTFSGALAQNQKLASSGFAAVSDTVGSGTLTFTFGTFASGTFTPNATAGSRTVTVAAGQSSLAGIRDALDTRTVVNA